MEMEKEIGSEGEGKKEDEEREREREGGREGGGERNREPMFHTLTLLYSYTGFPLHCGH